MIRSVILPLLAIAFGAFMFVYGGYDDSPGAQGLGLIIAIAGIASAVKSWRKR
jgi:hypothetical protein